MRSAGDLDSESIFSGASQLQRFYWLLRLFQSETWKSRIADRSVSARYRSWFPKSRGNTLRSRRKAETEKRPGRSSRATSRQTPRATYFPPRSLFRRPSRDLGGADVRRATHTGGERSAYGREAGALLSVSLSAGASLPPSPLFSRRRCHKVTRSLGSAGFTRAGVRTFDRSVSRSVAASSSPTGKYTLPIDDPRDFCAAHK